MKKSIRFLLLLSISSLFAQQSINVMSYNLFRFPSANPANRELILKDILATYPVDLLMVCELETEAGANLILNQALLPLNANYQRAVFYTNSSSNTDYIQQLVFYNSQKLILVSQQIYPTTIRDLNRYTFKLNTVEAVTNPVYLEVFVAHLKSSTGTVNQQDRLAMVTVFTNALASIPNNHYVLYGGDFNFYTASEPGYQEILDPTNAIVMRDPVNAAGSWQDNPNFKTVHTQCTRVSNAGFGSGVNAGGSGGMDDRFDFIMMSQNFWNAGNLTYVPNSYQAYGNNGNCLNLDINDSSCTGTFSQTLRDYLYWMSDHVPVVMQMETNQNFLSTTHYSLQSLQLENTITSTSLHGSTTLPLANTSYQIVNLLGELVQKNNLYGTTFEIPVYELPKGMYFLIITNGTSSLKKKFIKN